VTIRWLLGCLRGKSDCPTVQLLMNSKCEMVAVSSRACKPLRKRIPWSKKAKISQDGENKFRLLHQGRPYLYRVDIIGQHLIELINYNVACYLLITTPFQIFGIYLLPIQYRTHRFSNK
jgi:hypothetical protein